MEPDSVTPWKVIQQHFIPVSLYCPHTIVCIYDILHFFFASETGRSTVPLEWGADEMYPSGKPSYDAVLRKLLLAGDFLDVIFDHPETVHELVTDAELSKILKGLKPHLKNMLYYLFLRDYSATEYAESIGQSDRNIRGIRETALKKIRKLYTDVLTYRKENSLPMTIDEKYFLNNGVRKKKDSRQPDR